jgi:prepilin peptidase CpaA
MLIDTVRLLLFPALMAFAASSDLLTMTISNRLSLVLAGGFFLLTLATGMDVAAIGMHLAAAAMVLVIAFAMFTQGWIASLLGGALTLLLLQFRQLPLPGLLARQQWITRLHDKAGGVPYGIALAAAALIVYPSTGWMPAG